MPHKEISWDDPTVIIPNQTMCELVFGTGFASCGPDRLTLDMHPISIDEELSDGIPVLLEDGYTTEPISDGVPVVVNDEAHECTAPAMVKP